MTERYRFFHVDDDHSANLVNNLVGWGLVPSLAPGVGLATSRPPWDHWNPQKFVRAFHPGPGDLVELVLGLEGALDTFRNENHFDVVVLDVDLTQFGLGHVGGLITLYPQIIDHLRDTNRLQETLVVLYTGSTAVLNAAHTDLVNSVGEYRNLQESSRPIIIRVAEPDPENRTEFGGLLRSICDDFLTRRSRSRFLRSPDHVGALGQLEKLSASFQRYEFNELAKEEVDGSQMQHLFPFQFGAIKKSTDEDARVLVSQLYRTLRASFRLRFADFCDLLDRGDAVRNEPLRHIGTAPNCVLDEWLRTIAEERWCDAFSDLGDLHPNFDYVERLRRIVAEGDRRGLIKWVKALRSDSVDYMVENTSTRMPQGMLGKWCFWARDYEGIVRIITTNAKRHEKHASPEISRVDGDDGWFELRCRMGDGPANKEKVVQGLQRDLDRSSTDKLAELRYRVCEQYDGKIVIEGTGEDKKQWAVQVAANTPGVVDQAPTFEDGTRYVLRFPKGTW